jgi:hypothetical protein
LKKERRCVTTRPTRTPSWVNRTSITILKLTGFIKPVRGPFSDHGYKANQESSATSTFWSHFIQLVFDRDEE